jgi:hypothetical protein
MTGRRAAVGVVGAGGAYFVVDDYQTRGACDSRVWGPLPAEAIVR